MYKLVKTITNNNLSALIASLFYMLAPYRLLNAYTRLAVGEMISFVFIPIIFMGIYYILKGKTEKSYLYVLGTIGLLLSHNISTLLTFILGVIFILINIKSLKNKKIFKTLCISTVIIILSVLFFEVPLLEQKHNVDFEVFRYGKMYSKSSVMSHALNPLQLLYRNAQGPDSSMYFCIGIPILIGLLLTPFVCKNNKNKNYKYFLFVGLIATLMSTLLFPWFVMPDILLMIQFPWRMLVVIVFCFSIISGINIAYLIEKIKLKKYCSIAKIMSFTLLIVLSCLYSFSFISNLDMKIADNKYYEEPEIIDSTNQVSRYSSFLEYWPQKAIDNIDYIINRDNKVKLISGNADIQNEAKENGILNFNIDNIEENTVLELPSLFYKGYEVTYTPLGSNEKIKINNLVESDKGLVNLALDTSVSGHINIEYHATTLHKICMAISFSTIALYLIYLLISRLNRKNKEQKLLDKG